MRGGRAVLVEDNLPTDFLTDLGAYLQTCAHIELQLAAIICSIEAKFCTEPPTSKNSFPAVRKLPAGPLIKRFKAAANLLPNDAKAEVLRWGEYFESSKVTRHMAVHGAFHVEPLTGKLQVNFFHERESGKFEQEASLIDHLTTHSLLLNADASLRASYGLLELVNSLDKTNS